MGTLSPARGRLERFVDRLFRRARLRRALLAATVATVTVSLIAIAVGLTRFAGWIVLPWPLWTAWAAAALPLAVGLLALLPAPGRDAVVREADRRLGLEGLLLTAAEVAGEREPLCRLLERRAAEALADASPARALPVRPPAAGLIAPAVVLLAVGLNASAFTRSPAAGALVDEDARALSLALQQAAAEILERGGAPDVPGTLASPDVARRVLEVESALRSGEIDAARAREALAALSERVAAEATTAAPAEMAEPPAATPGERPVSWVAVLEALARDPSSARPVAIPGGDARGAGGPPGGAATGGDDDEAAGRGVAALRTRGPRVSGAATGEATWTIPLPSGSAEDGPDDPVGAAAGGSPPAPRETALTAGERRLVEAYRENLERERRRREAAAPEGDVRGNE